jgi:hypothetical protein
VVEEKVQTEVFVEDPIHLQIYLAPHLPGLESEEGPLRNLRAYPRLRDNDSVVDVIRLRDLDLVPRKLPVGD